MDARRLLILAGVGPWLAGCAAVSGLGSPRGAEAASRPAGPAAAATAVASSPAPRPPARESAAPLPRTRAFAAMAPIPDPAPARKALPSAGAHTGSASPEAGLAAIAAANVQARATSRARGFVGAVQVFAYDPGQVFEVWTAPLRVTTLSLSPGETLLSKAAGDTVRWQIGETWSGDGEHRRAHVMIKPLERGLETNLVLATDRRLYLLQLRSGPVEAFNTAVAWDLAAALEAPEPPPALRTEAVGPTSLAAPGGPLDADYRIASRGGRPPWTPRAVMTDGVRTYLAFPPALEGGEAPALFAVGPGRELRLVNYRQRGDLWVVDQVLDAAELRLGGRRPQIVRIERRGGGS